MNRISGLWEGIIGTTCKLRAIPAGWSYKDSTEDYGFTMDTEFTITGVYFRVTSEGRIHPVFSLDRIPGKLFKPSELWITSIPPEITYAGDIEAGGRLCGEFKVEDNGL